MLLPGGPLTTASAAQTQQPSIMQDDVSLNGNRRMVLNFGDRNDEEEVSPTYNQQLPPSGTSDVGK